MLELIVEIISLLGLNILDNERENEICLQLYMYQGVTGWYMVLQGVTWCLYTQCYMVLHRVEGCYTVLFGVRQGYMVLHDVKECYTVKHGVTWCSRVFQGVTRCYKVYVKCCSPWCLSAMFVDFTSSREACEFCTCISLFYHHVIMLVQKGQDIPIDLYTSRFI